MEINYEINIKNNWDLMCCFYMLHIFVRNKNMQKPRQKRLKIYNTIEC